MRMGPHVVKIVRAAPSTARDRMSTELIRANKPIMEPTMAKPSATIIIFFAPKRCARFPAGMATKMLAKVKIDISHDAVVASIENCAMIDVMMVGILYWMSATATPENNRTTPTKMGFWYLKLPPVSFGAEDVAGSFDIVAPHPMRLAFVACRAPI